VFRNRLSLFQMVPNANMMPSELDATPAWIQVLQRVRQLLDHLNAPVLLGLAHS